MFCILVLFEVHGYKPNLLSVTLTLCNYIYEYPYIYMDIPMYISSYMVEKEGYEVCLGFLETKSWAMSNVSCGIGPIKMTQWDDVLRYE